MPEPPSALIPPRTPEPIPPGEGSAPPVDPRDRTLLDNPSAVSTAQSSTWRRLNLTLLGDTDPDKDPERTLWQCFVRNISFIVLAGSQFILTVVFTAYGAATEASAPGHEGQNEFTACPEFAIMNLVWLLPTALNGYLLVWAHITRLNIREAGLERHLSELATGESDPVNTTRLDARNVGVEGLKGDRWLISNRSIILHTRLANINPLVTVLCNCITLLLWISRLDYCRAPVAPHIVDLTLIILAIVNLGYCVTFVQEVIL